MIKGIAGLSADYIRVKQKIDGLDVSTAGNSSQHSIFNRHDADLIAEVEETRKLVKQSVIEQVSFSKIGVEFSSLTSANLVLDFIVHDEVKELKTKAEQQLDFLDVPRNFEFAISQDDNGDIKVSGNFENGSAKEEILNKLNASDHFKETFNLLKTAEKVLKNNSFNPESEMLSYELKVAPNSVNSKVKTVPLDGNSSPNRITDEEMYLLARYGIAARKTTTIYLDPDRGYLNKK